MRAQPVLSPTRQVLVSGSLVVLAVAGLGIATATSSGSHSGSNPAKGTVVVRTGAHDDGFHISRIGLGDFSTPDTSGQRPGV